MRIIWWCFRNVLFEIHIVIWYIVVVRKVLVVRLALMYEFVSYLLERKIKRDCYFMSHLTSTHCSNFEHTVGISWWSRIWYKRGLCLELSYDREMAGKWTRHILDRKKEYEPQWGLSNKKPRHILSKMRQDFRVVWIVCKHGKSSLLFVYLE